MLPLEIPQDVLLRIHSVLDMKLKKKAFDRQRSGGTQLKKAKESLSVSFGSRPVRESRQ